MNIQEPLGAARTPPIASGHRLIYLQIRVSEIAVLSAYNGEVR